MNIQCLLTATSYQESRPEVVQLSIPGQPDAFTYGSAFSRGALIRQPDVSLIQVSGTAAIDEKGASLYPGDVRAQAARRRMYAHMVILILLTVGVFATMAFFVHRGKRTGAPATTTPAAKESGTRPEAKTEFEGLQGRWLRPDGGYVVEIREINGSGKMVAAYFNPRLINVSRAEASQEGTATKVFIELRDTNYPGAT